MISVNNPVNVCFFHLGPIAPAPLLPADQTYGEILVLGRDSSVAIRISKANALLWQPVLTAAPAINSEDPIFDDLGPIKVATPCASFTASQMGLDNNDDLYNTTVLVKKGSNDFLKLSLRSISRQKFLDALTSLTTMSSL